MQRFLNVSSTHSQIEPENNSSKDVTLHTSELQN